MVINTIDIEKKYAYFLRFFSFIIFASFPQECCDAECRTSCIFTLAPCKFIVCIAIAKFTDDFNPFRRTEIAGFCDVETQIETGMKSTAPSDDKIAFILNNLNIQSDNDAIFFFQFYIIKIIRC